MLCCRPRKEEYELNKDGDNDKSKKKDGNDPTDNNKQVNSEKEPAQEGLYEVVESPVQIKVTEHLESENKLELSCQPDGNQTYSGAKGDHYQDSPVGKGGNPQFASQMSFTSQSSLREDIYRSREKFFTSSHPFDESLSQGDRKSVSSTTDERFAFHQSKIRSQHLTSALHRITVEEEEMAEKIHAAVDRLEQVAQRLELLAANSPKPAGGAGGSAVSEADSAAVKAFDNLLSGDFASFLELSNKLGGDVQTMGVMVKDGFQKVRDCVVMGAKSKKPAPADMAVVFKPLSEQITTTQNFRDQNRKSKQFNHISGIAESIAALGWVAVEPAPVNYVKEMLDAGMFYFNRVLKDTKGTDGGEDHGGWIKSWKGTLQGMADYIKEYHTTGLFWNPQGGDAKSAAQSAGGAPPPPPPGGAPPPPPPPPPVDDSAPSSSGGQASSGGDAARAELFAALNKGSEITSGLKKVTDDMKTHKNPALRAQQTPAPPGVRAGPAPFKAASSAPKPAPKPTAPVAKTPVFELQGKKWLVEHQIGNKNLVISDANLKQVVYIYKCTDSLVVVKGKVNSITVDSCKKLAVVVDDLVSSVEFVNSQSVQAQVTGKCPTVSIDKTDGCMVYLSKDSMDAEIVTAKSSEMNILVPNPKEDGDYVEFALPEQFKTTWNGSKFVTDCTESV